MTDVKRKPKIIIVDGPNRAGKTTLVSNIKNKFGITNLIKNNAPAEEEDPNKLMWDLLMSLEHYRRQGVDALCDRAFFPTDIPYHAAIHRAFSPIANYSDMYSSLFELLGIYTVFVVAPVDVLIERHRQLGEHWHVKSEDILRRVADQYQILISGYKAPHTVIDTSIWNEEESALDKAWRDIIYYYQFLTGAIYG